jgi:hypothetical protein
MFMISDRFGDVLKQHFSGKKERDWLTTATDDKGMHTFNGRD